MMTALLLLTLGPSKVTTEVRLTTISVTLTHLKLSQPHRIVQPLITAMAYQSSGKDGTDDFDMQTIGNFLSCASRGDRVGLNLMLRDGTSPNVQDYDNRTALHLAASEGHASIVELLLHYKADVNLDDRWHRTPLTDARLYGHRDICRILEVNGGKDSVMNSPMTVRYEEDAKEVNIEISEINSDHSERIEQGVLGDSEKVKWRGTWVVKTIIKRQINFPVKMVLSANDNSRLRELRHPNILQFLGSIMHDGQMILITEHLPRGSLDDILSKKIGLDLPLALRFALDIARGMNYLHHHKPCPIIHNHLDPKNLLQDEGGHLKIGEYWVQMLYELYPNQESQNAEMEVALQRRGLLYCLMMMMMVVVLTGKGKAQLVQNFYASTCPMVEAIVKQTVDTKVSQTFTTIPATLRLFFHDCFVEGCDASVMIASPSGDAEKDAEDNLSLAGDGFDTVIKAKEAVESVCPGVVSCADVLAIAARDVVGQAGGPLFSVELGRRDGLISQASRVAQNLPGPSFNLNQLNTMFARNNLTETDMIALSGAHTLGFSHCNRFANRLYSFSPASAIDPSLDPTYAQQLMAACPQNVKPDIAINMDPQTPTTFDNVYYQNLLAGKGLFTSDQVLFTDSSSRPTINDFANNPGDFNAAFITAMRKLGRTGVKMGNQGEIRRDCTAFN